MQIGGDDELIDLLRRSPVVLRGLSAGLDDAAIYRRDADGWSIVEIVGHLIDAERRAIERIALIRDADQPVLEGYDQAAMVEQLDYQSQPLPTLLSTFETLRAERVALLESLAPADWDRKATLSTAGEASLRDITLHMCWHDVNHLAQIAAARK